MITALQNHRQHLDWDLADNRVAHCSDLVEEIGTNNLHMNTDLPTAEFLDSSEDFQKTHPP